MSAEKLASWGRYPSYLQSSHPCHWRKELQHEITHITEKHGNTLPYGNGLSYGDSCLAASDHVIRMRTLDRLIKADWENGILVAESGVTLEEVLSLSIPRGWFLPVTPGTKYVTLGGAVANDVHGKNHHVRGTFGCHLRRFGLTRSDQSETICSKDENAGLFTSTIGGLGLTGIITWVEFQLIPIRSSLVDTVTIRFDSLGEFFALSRELDQSHEYTVAWVDCLGKGKSIGRGVFMVGDHANVGPLQVSNKRKISIPFTPPISIITPISLRLFNTIYYRKHKPGHHTNKGDYDPFFYPLDSLLKWNRIYGPKGFQQYQCVVPDNQAKDAIGELLATIATSGNGSFLAVMKRCGDIKSPGLLSFPVPGVSLALDFPQKDSVQRLFTRLDTIVREAGGRLYPAKDAHMSGSDFRSSYPNWEQVEALRDPALCSRFWNRVTIK